MSDQDSTSLGKRFREFYLPRRQSALLVACVAFLAVRPVIGEGRAERYVFAVAVVVLLIVALYTIQVEELAGEHLTLLAERRRRNLIGWSLAGAALVMRTATIVWPTHVLYVIGSLSYLLFFGFVAWQELRAVLRQQTITTETISMSVSIYLLLGITWGLLYLVIYERNPLAFNFPARTGRLQKRTPFQPSFTSALPPSRRLGSETLFRCLCRRDMRQLPKALPDSFTWSFWLPAWWGCT